MFENAQTRKKNTWPKNSRKGIRRSRLYEPENVHLDKESFQPRIPFENQHCQYSMDQDSYFQNQIPFRRDTPIRLPGSFDVLSSERSYLLSKLQRADVAATDLLQRISHLVDNNKLETDRNIAKKNRHLIGWFKSKLHETTKQEHSILLRLGQVSYEIQYTERWNRIENERFHQQQLNQNYYSFPTLETQYPPLSPLAGPAFFPSDSFTTNWNYAPPHTLNTIQTRTEGRNDVNPPDRVWQPDTNHDDYLQNPTTTLPSIPDEPVELAASSFPGDSETKTSIGISLNPHVPSEKRPLSLNTLLNVSSGNVEREKRLSLPALKSLWDEIPGDEMERELEQKLEEENEASGQYIGYYIQKEA